MTSATPSALRQCLSGAARRRPSPTMSSRTPGTRSRSRTRDSTSTCSPFQREVRSTRPTYSTRGSRASARRRGEQVGVDARRDQLGAAGRVRQRDRRDRDQLGAAGEDAREDVTLVGAQQYVDGVVALDQRAGVVGHHHRHGRGERGDVGETRDGRVGVDDVDVEPGEQAAYLPGHHSGFSGVFDDRQPGAEPDDRDAVVALLRGPARVPGGDDRDVAAPERAGSRPPSRRTARGRRCPVGTAG